MIRENMCIIVHHCRRTDTVAAMVGRLTVVINATNLAVFMVRAVHRSTRMIVFHKGGIADGKRRLMIAVHATGCMRRRRREEHQSKRNRKTPERLQKCGYAFSKYHGEQLAKIGTPVNARDTGPRATFT